MLNIIKGDFYSALHTELTEKIARLVGDGKKALLIVPEQQTVLSESELSRLLPPFSVLSFEVTNFTRLANSAFRTLGGISGEYCDKGKRALIMWRTLTELSPMLSMTSGKREVSVGAVERALRAVGEMQSLGIGTEELSKLCATEAVSDDTRLMNKLRDLSEIYSMFKDKLAEKYTDSADDVSAFAALLQKHREYLADTEIFIEGFTSFTEPQYTLITRLAERTAVTAALSVSHLREDAFEYTEIRKSEERLKRCARLAKADLKLTKCKRRRDGACDALTAISELLWFKTHENDNIALQNPDEVRIFRAETPYVEAEFIASDIKSRVMRGDSYSDFAVISANMDSYAGIIDTALTRAEIPIFTSTKRDVSSFEIIKLIYTAYSAVRSGFSREDVLTYAKCGLSGIGRDECDEFEMYVNKWQLSGLRFTDGLIWNMNPDGFTSHRSSAAAEKLLRINMTKDKLLKPILCFASMTEGAKTVKEHASALLTLLLSLECEERLSERSDALTSLGESEMAEANRKLWGLICDALDSFVEVSGDCECSPDAFLSQLKILFSSAEVGRIPALRDSVTLGSADMLRLYPKKHVYLVGVNEGEFPGIAKEDSYFSEKDKERLHALGLTIEPTLEIDGARELYSFSRAFSYADRSVTLLYTAADARFKATAPSEVLARITAVTGGAVKPTDVSSLPAIDRLYSSADALGNALTTEPESYPSLREALIRSGLREELKRSEGKLRNTDMSLSEELASKIYGKELPLTQSRLDSYRSCPLAHFCRYTVKLSREERAEFDAPGIGTFIHAILENFFSLLAEEKRVAAELSEEEKRDLTMRAAKKYVSALGESVTDALPETRVKLDRLCRAAIPVVDGLCEEFSTSGFSPSFFELQIKKNAPDSPAPVALKGDGHGDIYVYGVIDRVDTYKRGDDVFVRVVDYKTGHKSFSPEDLDQGKNLQMFLYLQSILKTESEEFRKKLGVTGEGRIIPAGVIYVKTDVSDKTVSLPDDALAREAVMSAQERQGMVLDDEDVISAMGLRYTPLYSPRYGDTVPAAKRNLLFSVEDFEALMEKVEDRVSEAASKMRSGRISATPSLDERGVYACSYCEFKPICRFVKQK